VREPPAKRTRSSKKATAVRPPPPAEHIQLIDSTGDLLSPSPPVTFYIR